MKTQIKLLVICGVLFYTFYLWTQLMSHDDHKPIVDIPTPISPEEVVVEEPSKEITVSVFRQSNEVKLPLEVYLIGVVSAEMPVSFEIEALKAQAIAARTFVAARKFYVDDTTASQVYKSDSELQVQWGEQYSSYIEKIKLAVNETRGKVLTYLGEPITAAFFSSSNGKTNNAQDYWVNEVEYLKTVDSHWDNEVKENEKDVTISKSEFAAKMGISELNQLAIIENYENGYVKRVQLNEDIKSGREIREKLSLASSSFTLTIENDTITFHTVGSGHGIGMSQYGANGMALEGATYEEILNHYYQNVKIEDLMYN